jgi:hypothetical protein
MGFSAGQVLARTTNAKCHIAFAERSHFGHRALTGRGHPEVDVETSSITLGS